MVAVLLLIDLPNVGTSAVFLADDDTLHPFTVSYLTVSCSDLASLYYVLAVFDRVERLDVALAEYEHILKVLQVAIR